jgi:hypothetical protein
MRDEATGRIKTVDVMFSSYKGLKPCSRDKFCYSPTYVCLMYVANRIANVIAFPQPPFCNSEINICARTRDHFIGAIIRQKVNF